MILRWLGIALLAFSWLVGLQYYDAVEEPFRLGPAIESIMGVSPPPWLGAVMIHRPVWTGAVLVGALLLVGSLPRMPGPATAAMGMGLMLPAIFLAPWPHRAGPLLVVAGLACLFLPLPRRWRESVGSGGFAAGLVLLAQSLAMFGYEGVTARSHELPRPLPELVGMIAKALGIDAAVSGSDVTLHSMRSMHTLGATWELVLDPMTLSFLVGGLVFIGLRSWSCAPRGARAASFWKPALGLTAAVLLWLPVRTGFQLALYLHRVLRTDYGEPLSAATQFWNEWAQLALLLVPVLLGCVFGRVRAAAETSWSDVRRKPRRWFRPLAAALVFAGIGAVTVALFWEPAGERKRGRVLIDEFHSKWESTERAYDTEWYGKGSDAEEGADSGYNYYCIYDYASRYYEMARLKTAISEAALAQCDVLVLKCPTERFAPSEVRAIREFVERGGGLLLIGEHTNFRKMGTHLNDVAKGFGFRFRYDCLFGIASVFEQHYEPPLVPHPIVQRMPALDFAISCSIAPGMSRGRAVIRGRGLKSLMADYHARNFYPQPEDRPEMRYGAFVQLWATRHEAGRVVGFGDSTVFSNFSAFEPGKAELMLGMLEWLNHRNMGWPPQPWLGVLGLALMVAGLVLGRRWPDGWVVLIGAGLLGWAAAAAWVRAEHLAAVPAPKPVRPFVRVVIDRTVCTTRLPSSGFIGGKADEFGIFERWILRLGYFTVRASGPAAPDGDLVVFLYPTEPPTREFLDALERYVDAGGRVLVIDLPERASTAGELVRPFGLSRSQYDRVSGGRLEVPEGWPEVPAGAASEVRGGQVLARLNGRAVAATVRRGKGKGSVTLIGFGSRFTDREMGVTGDAVPNAELRSVFELEFKLVRAIVEDKLPVPLPARPAAPTGERP